MHNNATYSYRQIKSRKKLKICHPILDIFIGKVVLVFATLFFLANPDFCTLYKQSILYSTAFKIPKERRGTLLPKFRRAYSASPKTPRISEGTAYPLPIITAKKIFFKDKDTRIRESCGQYHFLQVFCCIRTLLVIIHPHQLFNPSSTFL